MDILRREDKSIKEWLVLPVAISFLLVFAAQFCSGDFPAYRHLSRLLKNRGFQHLLDAESVASNTLPGFGKEVVVLVPNSQLKTFCKSKAFVTQWLKENIEAQSGNVNIVGVAVGRQVLTRRRDLLPFLVPAMKATYAALTGLYLDHYIKVSTLVSSKALSLLGPFSLPGLRDNSTRASGSECLDSMFGFLHSTVSYLILEDISHSLNEKGAGGNAIQAALRAMTALGYPDIPVIVADELLCRRLDADPINGKFDSFLLQRENLPVARFEQWENFTIQCAGSNLSTIRDHLYQADILRRRTLLQQSTTPKQTWCVAIEGIDDSTLQAALDYACGQAAADCQPIKFGKPCFLPNTVSAHASYVFNSYYQRNARAAGTCSFSGAAAVTSSNPSHGSCEFPFSGSLNQTTMVIQQNDAKGQMVRLDIALLTLSLALLSW